MSAHQNYLMVIDGAEENPSLREYFAEFNFEIQYYSSIEQIKNTETPFAILISLDQLDKNQFQLLKTLYDQYTAPLIVINDDLQEDMCIQSLEAGADDYLIKPLYPREVHARLNAIQRRIQRSIKNNEQDIMLFGNWKLYTASRQLFNEYDHEIVLSAGEYELLFAFVKQPQHVLGREYLLQLTKNSDLNPFDRRVDVQISRLRQKIEVDAKKPILIKTIRNEGYLFTSTVIIVKNTTSFK